MQEFMVLPVGADSFSQAMQMGCEVYHNLKVRARVCELAAVLVAAPAVLGLLGTMGPLCSGSLAPCALLVKCVSSMREPGVCAVSSCPLQSLILVLRLQHCTCFVCLCRFAPCSL